MHEACQRSADGFREGVGQWTPPDREAIEEWESFFSSLAPMCEEMSVAVLVLAEKIPIGTPLAWSVHAALVDFSVRVANMAADAAEADATWQREHEYDRNRQFNPGPGEAQLNTGDGGAMNASGGANLPGVGANAGFYDPAHLTGDPDEDAFVRQGRCPYQVGPGSVWYCGDVRSPNDGDHPFCRTHAARIRDERGRGGYVAPAGDVDEHRPIEPTPVPSSLPAGHGEMPVCHAHGRMVLAPGTDTGWACPGAASPCRAPYTVTASMAEDMGFVPAEPVTFDTHPRSEGRLGAPIDDTKLDAALDAVAAGGLEFSGRHWHGVGGLSEEPDPTYPAGPTETDQILLALCASGLVEQRLDSDSDYWPTMRLTDAGRARLAAHTGGDRGQTQARD
jgi:hypothetical protein